MSTYESTWRLKFDPNSINKGVKDVTDNLDKAVKRGNALGDCFKRLKAIDLMAIDSSVQNIKDRLQGVSDIAIKNESALAEVSAITGVVGAELDKLNDQAKGLSRTYGEDLNANLDSFKTILSRLGPDIGKSDKAMGGLGESVNILAKGMEGDIVGATDAITTSMLQFQVDLKNPVKAAEESKRMINVMAAGAKEGAAEIPQIGQALVAAGVSAKLANLSFEETNAAIQAMAGGGKYGSEAGVAIRNVITNMSASTSLSKEAVTILGAYGIKTKELADKSVPWADRLKKLAPLQNDINALTSIFGRENAASAQILIRSANAQAELTKQITGTNVAYEQAAIIMDTKAEEEKRRNQRWNLFKLQIGNVTKQFQPYINITANAISITANLKNAHEGLMIVLNAVKTLLGIDTLVKGVNAFVTTRLTKEQLKLALVTNSLKFSMLWASLTTFGFAAAMQTLKTSINAVSVSIMSIPVIGWVIALVAALAALFVYLWNTSGKFRGFFYGVWNVIKLVFSGIWQLIKDFISKVVDLFMWWFGMVKKIFGWVVNVISESWNWVAAKFQWAWSVISNIAINISNVLRNVFSGIFNFFKSVFGGIWDFVAGVFDKIWQKIKSLIEFLKPLTDAVSKLFSKAGGEFSKGMNQGIKEVAAEKRKKQAPGQKVNPLSLSSDATGGVETPTKSVNYDALFGAKEKKKKGRGVGVGEKEDGLSMSGSKGDRTINQTITINNYFSAAKQQAGRIADEVAGKINDRLRDGMVALD